MIRGCLSSLFCLCGINQEYITKRYISFLTDRFHFLTCVWIMFGSSAHISCMHRLGYFAKAPWPTAFMVLPGLPILSSLCKAFRFRHDNTLPCTLLSNMPLFLYFSLCLCLSVTLSENWPLCEKMALFFFFSLLKSVLPPSPFSADVEVCSASHFHSAPLPPLRLACCLIRSWWRRRLVWYRMPRTERDDRCLSKYNLEA